MNSIRRFLRYDVEIPLYLEMVNMEGVQKRFSESDVITLEELDSIDKMQRELKNIMEDVANLDSDTIYTFHLISHKTNFMVWLLEHLMKNSDPTQSNDFKFRTREFKKLRILNTLEGSKIGALITGIDQAVVKHVNELTETISNSIEGKIFLYPRGEHDLFDSTNYVKNLQTLADKGVSIAKVLVLFIQILNKWETAFNRLKALNKHISEPSDWELTKINLSAGGLSLISTNCYEKFSYLNIFMGLGDQILICRGKMVVCTQINDDTNRIAIQFDFLSMENADKITLFLQRQELLDAMKKIAL